MPPHDWERDDRFRSRTDQPDADRDLAGRDLARRLSRLPSSHPSAWAAADRADAEYRERSQLEWWRAAPDGEPEDVADEPEDLPDDVGDEPGDVADGPDDVPPGEDSEDAELLADEPAAAGRQVAPARGGRRPEASTGWGELAGPSARSPYRPWFSTDGAGDPWFAVRETE